MYRYETHLHTAPVSACGQSSAYDTVAFYKQIGYDGIFITNHFIDGNIGIAPDAPYEEKIRFFFSDYEEGVKAGKELGLKVFGGVEMCYLGTEFLVYGLEKEWYLDHPEIQHMPCSEKLTFMRHEGALIIQAHPYREANYIDHIRLYPRHVHGVETYNACRTELENAMAQHYAESYGLLPFAGTDNHLAGRRKTYGGMESETPLVDEQDFIQRILANQMKPFRLELE